MNLEKRTVLNFDYIKNGLSVTADEKNKNSNMFINQNQTAKRILEELEKTNSLPEANENPIKKLKLDQVPGSKEPSFKKELDFKSTNVKKILDNLQ